MSESLALPGPAEHGGDGARLARAHGPARDTATFAIAGGARIAVPDAAGLDRLTCALEGYEP